MSLDTCCPLARVRTTQIRLLPRRTRQRARWWHRNCSVLFASPHLRVRSAGIDRIAGELLAGLGQRVGSFTRHL